MKRSALYLFLAGLLLLTLTFFALTPRQSAGAVVLEEVLITATLAPTLTASDNDDGITYVDTPNPADSGVAAQGAVILAATATRTPTPINIGNFVWDDRDKDGVQDAREPGMAGVTVQLWNSAKNDLIASTTTNASGIYTVIAPIPGDYRIRVLLPNPSLDNFSPKDVGTDTTDSDINPSGGDKGFTDAFNIASNVISITSKDTGIIRYVTPTPTRTPTPINVGNFVWDDRDHDGIQDASEPGIAGVTVQLWNDAKNDLIDSTVTNASGVYSLIAPTPGDYRLRVVLPNTLDQFSPKNVGADDTKDSDINTGAPDLGFTDVYTFASNLISITTMDAGIIRYVTPTPTRTPTPINVGNFVWDDRNSNGVQDAGEPGMNGVTVQLWNEAKTQLIDTAVTNANGIYTLIAPTPGNYRVRVLLPNMADQFSVKDASTDTSDSDINPSGANAGFTDTYVFASNLISITTIDAGIIRYLTPTPTATATPTRTPTPSPTISAPLGAPSQNFYTSTIIRLTWGEVSWAVGYAIEVDNNSNFSSPAYANYSLGANTQSTFVFLPLFNDVYHWRVGAKRADGTYLWGTAQTFTVDLQP
jgi:hypothetical protein